MNMKPAPVFISETAPIEPVGYHMAQDLFESGHHPINPILHNSGIIEYERGAAAVGITPYGEMVLLSTTDVEDMVIEHRFVKDGEYTSMSEKELDDKVSLKKRVVGEPILNDGRIYLGQFVKEEKEDGRGSNYDHLLGIAAWKPSPKQFVQNVLTTFSNYHRQDLLDSGILMQHSALNWTSQEMVFVAKPMAHKNVLGVEVPTRNADGEQLYCLHTLVAPGKGLNASKLYYKNFPLREGKEEFSLSRPIMRPLVSLLMEKDRGLTMAQIDARIQRRFSPTVKLLRQGKSHFAYKINGDGDERIHGWQRAKGFLNSMFSHAVFGLNDISKLDVAVGVGLPAVIAIGGVLTEQEDGFTLAAAATPTVIVLARFAFLWFTRSNHHFESTAFNDLIHNFWPDGVKTKNIPQQFEMVHHGVIRNLRILPRNELNRLMRIPSNYSEEVPSWDVLYTIGMQNGPYGSRADFHKIGNQWVVRVREDMKNSGMTIEYWPQLDVAFSKDATSSALPKPLLNKFRQSADPIQMIEAERDENDNIVRYNCQFISQEDYNSKIADLQQRPARDIYRSVEKTGALLTGYPRKEIVDKNHGEHAENEWAADSKAATFAEIVVEVSKFILRGPKI